MSISIAPNSPVSIKMCEITFVPTWEDPTGTKHCMIGRLEISISDLPAELQQTLEKLVEASFRAQFTRKGK
jgi:hypothetical protein